MSFSSSRSALVLVVLASSFSACAQDKAEATLETITFRGSVLDFSTESAAGASQLCLRGFDSLECGDDDGSGFNMQIPAGEDVALDVTHASFAPHLVHHRGLGGASFDLPLLGTAELDALAQVSGSGGIGSGGAVFLLVTDGEFGRSGVAATLEGSSAMPVYYDNLRAPDPELSNSSGAGYLAFDGVAPGNYALSLSFPDSPCGSFVRGANEDGSYDVVVEAGTVTYAGTFECSDAIAPAGGDATGGTEG